MSVIKYDKAIRDLIPEIIAQAGKECDVEKVSQQEFLAKLAEKLGEEVAEFQADPCIEELADIVEVIRALLKYLGYTWEELEQVRTNKLQERGGFSERLVLKQVRSVDSY